jgi:hypothetical protein
MKACALPLELGPAFAVGAGGAGGGRAGAGAAVDADAGAAFVVPGGAADTIIDTKAACKRR